MVSGLTSTGFGTVRHRLCDPHCSDGVLFAFFFCLFDAFSSQQMKFMFCDDFFYYDHSLSCSASWCVCWCVTSVCLPACLSISAETALSVDQELSNWWSCTHPKARWVCCLFAARVIGSARHHLLDNEYATPKM
jgi:hypothetical protein